MIKSLFIFLLIITSFSWGSIPPFKFITSLNYSYLHLQFPDNRITNIKTIDVSQINKKYRPAFWPPRIPFIAGIYENKIFYYQFKLLGHSILHSLETKQPPIDVAVTAKGNIVTITDTEISTYHYNFTNNSITLIHTYPFNNPFKLVSNHSNLIAALTKEKCHIFNLSKNKLVPHKSLNLKLEKHLKNETLINISLAKNGNIAILTTKYILFFSSKGSLIKKIQNEYNLNLIDSTSFSDYICGSSSHKTLYKFSKKGTFLFSFNIKEIIPIELSIYKPYGNLALFDNKKANYYSMNTDIAIKNCNQKKTKSHLSINCSTKITFPSSITATIYSKTTKNSFILENTTRESGNHIFNWENIPTEYENGSIKFSAKALYSSNNIINKEFKLNDSN